MVLFGSKSVLPFRLLLTTVVFLGSAGTVCSQATHQKDKPSTSVRATRPLAELKKHLAIEHDKRLALADCPFASDPLSRSEARNAQRLLWADHVSRIKETGAIEMEAGMLQAGDLEMPFSFRTFGKKPKAGWSLYISMHGGGGAPKRVNDQQWENQKRLYQPTEGIYLAPRAPTNTWDLWHQSHIDVLFSRLIKNLIALQQVNPDRVYLMGYSAGGDGAYQLAPRMADRWAAVSMMAGHPGDASPLGLRNIGFAIYMGGNDAAYNRNQLAAEWKTKLAKLQQRDPGGYKHLVTIYPDKGHWMDREDASSLEWMGRQTRNPVPRHVVWRQDNVRHDRFYWLKDSRKALQPGATVVAKQDGQDIQLELSKCSAINIRINDEMLNLDRPVRILSAGREIFKGKVNRTIRTLHKTLAERGDPRSVFSAEVAVKIPE